MAIKKDKLKGVIAKIERKAIMLNRKEDADRVDGLETKLNEYREKQSQLDEEQGCLEEYTGLVTIKIGELEQYLDLFNLSNDEWAMAADEDEIMDSYQLEQRRERIEKRISDLKASYGRIHPMDLPKCLQQPEDMLELDAE